MNPSSGIALPAVPARTLRSATILLWLRRTHGWFGLWGAVLGLLFGTGGIWLNHRSVMKLPMAQERSNAQVAVPEAATRSPQDMAAWLREALQQANPPHMTRIEPARKLAWGLGDGAPAMQPAHWTFGFGGPDQLVQADYWQGNRTVGVVTTRNGLAATLANLHKGVGMPAAWILLVDTLAGSMIFLSVSGVAIWVLMHRRRARAGLAILATSLLVTGGIIAWRVAG